ncbi:MAG: hypothetical protein HY280_00260 [Nitrospinae bacterium]|nr:hypothetical protein [Nitrospinota bacterium]
MEKSRRQFNLLYEGTGIRFRPSLEKPKPPIFSISLVLLLASAVAGVLVYQTQYVPSVSPQIVVVRNTLDAVSERAGSAATAFGGTQQQSANSSESSAIVVRFGLFTSREEADAMAETLQKHDIFADVKAAQKPVRSYTVKIWPVSEKDAVAKLEAELARGKTPLNAKLTQEFLVVGPVWAKQGAMAAARMAIASGLHAQVEEQDGPKEIFEVVSLPLDNQAMAQYKMTEWRNKGFEGAIEK